VGAAVTLFLVSVIVFVLLALAPGDPAEMILMGRHTTPEAIAQLRHELGLDMPLHIQYARFVWDALRGDLGRSWQNNEPVTREIGRVFPATVELTLLALLTATVVGITMGVIAAVRQNSVLDVFTRSIGLLGVSVPIFWLGLMLISLFAVRLHWFPSSGRGSWKHLVLPVICLATYSVAIILRMVRSCMLEVLQDDYVRTARAKGLPERIVHLRHAFRNAYIPIITVIGLQLGFLLGGAIVTETVFAYPGLGWTMMQALFARNYPVVRGGVLLMATSFIIVNLVVDILYVYLDPRIRYG
jgi:ABC-type dipeptide/oligopeptide/nickel transport system permease component